MKQYFPLALLLSAALLLQGCASAASAVSTTAKPEVTPTTEPAPETEPIPEEDTRPELVRVLTEKPTGVDSSCYAEVYETLYSYEDGKFVPVLASGAWEHTAGEESYTVTLSADISDSEGNPFTASDAAVCFENCGDELFESAEVSEEGRLVLNFSRELESAEERLFFAELPLYTTQGDDESEIYGTGPYKIAEQSEESLTLIPNESYRGESGDRQRVKEIQYLFLSDAASRVIALETGKADLADCLSYDEAEDFLPDGSYSDLFYTLDFYSDTARFLLPNVSSQSALSSEDLRLAIFSLLDCEALAEKLGGRACTGFGNPDWIESSDGSYQITVPDAESGYEALRDASYEQENLILLCSEDGEGRRMAESIQLLWEKVGVCVLLKPVSEEETESALADLSAWDLALIETENNSSLTAQWLELWGWEEKATVLRGGENDAVLLNLLQTVSQSENATAEMRERLQERVLNHGFALALPQLCEPRVISNSVETAAMNARGALLPGEFVYEEGENNG